MYEQITTSWFIKVIAAVMGALCALMLSGDIDTQGRIKITKSVILKFSISVSISLYGGSAFIEYFSLTKYTVASQGFVMLLFAIFGILLIGIVYQALRLLKGKPLNEIVLEIKQAFKSLLK